MLPVCSTSLNHCSLMPLYVTPVLSTLRNLKTQRILNVAFGFASLFPLKRHFLYISIQRYRHYPSSGTDITRPTVRTLSAQRYGHYPSNGTDIIRPTVRTLSVQRYGHYPSSGTDIIRPNGTDIIRPTVRTLSVQRYGHYPSSGTDIIPC